MKAAQPFSGHHLPKKYFGQRSLRQCARSGKGDNIVLIEVDSDDFGDVIILDVPESFQEKFSKNKEPHVISDDDGDYGDDDGSKSRAGEHDMPGDATTSYRFSSAPKVRSSNRPNVVKGGLFVGEGSKPVKLSKSKRTYSATGLPRNKYGLCSDSESCSSDSDDSDFELMEDPFGKLHEQWEKASFKRRHDTSRGYFDSEDKDGPSASNPPVHNSAEKATAKQSEPTSKESTPNHENDGLKFGEESKFSEQESDAMDIDELCTRNHGNHHGSSDLRNDGTGESNQPVHHSIKPSTTEHSDLARDDLFFKSSFINDGWNGVSSDFSEMLAEQNKSSQQGNEAKEAENVYAGGHSDDVTKGAANRDVENDLATYSDGEQIPESPIAASMNSSESHSTGSNSFDKNDIITGDVTKGATIQDVETDFATFSGGEQSTERPVAASTNLSDSRSTESKYPQNNDILTDRQKIKETDEYKRAMEEEWAMRQQQLQLQAEEVHRLRNRKRAENMRIKDNERRQRQRLEEVRETRRKDEENLNLKDKLRVQIRSELRKLETMYFDMASLLRALGVHVNGGFHPSSNEVQAAYKRACLRFHPDRQPTTDLRQQVEAEEKFKLISNMKDKLCQNR